MTADLGWWTKNLGDRPEIFAHQLDVIGDKILLVELSAAEKQAASFLDQRVITPQTKGVWLTWDQIQPHIPTTPTPHFIFHIGHCGSTLLSRLLDALGTDENPVTGLREPLPLRTLAQEKLESASSLWSEAVFKQRLRALLCLYGREPGTTIIKATSICNSLIEDMMEVEPPPTGKETSFRMSPRAAFIYIKLEPYLAAMLGGENSSVDLRGFATLRHRRLTQKIGPLSPLRKMTLGEIAAMSWLVEMLDGYYKKNDRSPFYSEPLDFDQFLQDPAEHLSALAGHFGVANDAAAIQQALGSGVMSRYAKSPDYQYTADTRTQNLNVSRRENAREITAGLKWAEALIKSHSDHTDLAKLLQ